MNPEATWARAFVGELVALAPRRVAGSDDERVAHERVRRELAALGLSTEVRPFTWNRSIYENLALHFGLGALGSLVAGRAPLIGLALHAGTALSYLADSTREAFPLRSLLPRIRSQNVVATRPARGPVRLRIVLLSHVDAAYTGVVFRPSFVRRFGSRPGSATYKGLRVATGALAALAALDLWSLAFGRSRRRDVARALLTVPPLLSFALNADVVARDQVVPGAMDDLSGVAGMILLARRWIPRLPDDVELVCVATGAEEAGLGGAQALVAEMADAWSKRETVILGLDGLANGALRVFDEGEIVPARRHGELRARVLEVAASNARFEEVTPFDIPVGGTDALPFAQRGYSALTLGCVDAECGMPRHYHLPTDTPENLEAEKIPFCVDFADAVIASLIAKRREETGPEKVKRIA